MCLQRSLPSLLLATMFGCLAVVELLFSRADWTLAHVMPNADGLVELRPSYTLGYIEWNVSIPMVFMLCGDSPKASLRATDIARPRLLHPGPASGGGLRACDGHQRLHHLLLGCHGHLIRPSKVAPGPFHDLKCIVMVCRGASSCWPAASMPGPPSAPSRGPETFGRHRWSRAVGCASGSATACHWATA